MQLLLTSPPTPLANWVMVRWLTRVTRLRPSRKSCCLFYYHRLRCAKLTRRLCKTSKDPLFSPKSLFLTNLPFIAKSTSKRLSWSLCHLQISHSFSGFWKSLCLVIWVVSISFWNCWFPKILSYVNEDENTSEG